MTKIIGKGKFKSNLIAGRIITLPSFLHILGLARNFIFIIKMDDVGLETMF
jgi:hypothetical protein